MAKTKYMHIYPFKVDFTEGTLKGSDIPISELMETALLNLIKKEKRTHMENRTS